MGVKELGVERILFATDMTMEGGVGKILGADLTEAQRERIFWQNFQAILDKRIAILDRRTAVPVKRDAVANQGNTRRSGRPGNPKSGRR